MSQEGRQIGERPGPIAYMASNGVAANLLMVGIIAAGLISFTGLEQEAWPELPFNQVEVSVAYPGATPEEVEESIVIKIEEQVSSIDDVKTVRSLAAQGMASVRVEMRSGANLDDASDDIESVVNSIQTLPASAERPEFREMTNRQSIMRLIVYGDIPERSLKELAYQIEDQLAQVLEASHVETTGVRADEISVEVPQSRLRALGLTLQDISNVIRADALDLSAGSIETREAKVLVRTLGRRYTQYDFEEIVVLARGDGMIVRLGDIAEVRDGFEESSLIVRHQGKPAAFVEVSRGQGDDVADVVATVKEYVETTVRPSLPHGVEVTIWNDDSEIFAERLDLLFTNGSLGFILVFTALTLFLNLRLAIWVAVGLVVSGIGALSVLLLLDLPINSFSLFAFVLAIGIIVDDAIVVAENIHEERSRGVPGLVAAIRGTRRIKTPLIFAVLTSVAAFAPLLILPGGIGEIMRPMPVVVISMLFFSLVESLLVLPNHLSHLPGPDWSPSGSISLFLQRIQSRVDRALKRFVQGPLDRSLRFATGQPGVVMSGAIGLLILCMSLLMAGVVRFNFADEIPNNIMTVSLTMPDGTPAHVTAGVATEIEEAGHRAIDRFSQDGPADAPPLLSGVTTAIGQGPRVLGGGLVAESRMNPQANLATIEFKLLSSKERQVGTETLLQAWREEIGEEPRAQSLTFAGEVVSLGNPVEVVLSHPDPARLGSIADAVEANLRRLQGVFDVRSDHARGIQEIQLELKPEARTLGLTLDGMARQTRAAFFGEEALRMQRGREEVRVYTRLPADERDAIADVEGYLIRTPRGGEVPLSQVASVGMGTSPPSIPRQDGRRIATVTADVDAAITSGTKVNGILERTVLAELTAANPGTTYSFGGEAQQQIESFEALQRGFILAMFAIFAMLAIPLRSYTKPLLIMSVIPFGFIGAILGHLILGEVFTFVSAMGFLGLSGVVVNDSLVMIDFIDQKMREGLPQRTAIVEGAKGRFRPIMLTSVTTFLGFTPIYFEQASQAQFLVRFAASMGFGIMITTALLLLIVPALIAIHMRKRIQMDERAALHPA